MNWKKVSVLVPTRKRLDYLDKMLESFGRTVTNPDQAELIFRCDSDDKESIERLCASEHKVIIGPRKEGYKVLPGFYNEMAAVASGDVLMCCNDDVVFQTPNWPSIVLEEANKYPDGIFNFGVDVGLNNDKFPFSIVSRRLVEILGFINDERLLFSDVFLLDVMKHFNRAIPLPSVRIFHNWAGHGHDETRRDANLHEKNLVFKDDQGNWTDGYRSLHDRVVGEAVKKIKRQSGIMVDLAVNSLMAYKPPSKIGPNAVWPPRVRCRSWYNRTAPNAIHYPELGIRKILDLIYEMSLDGGEALVSSYNSGLPNILWGSVFDKVVSIRHDDGKGEVVRDGKHVIMPGSVDDTRFLYKIMEEFSNLKFIVLDAGSYAAVISVYFLFRKLVQSPGLIIFINCGGRDPVLNGVHRFVNDLARGYLDERKHQIIPVDNDDAASPGLAYEVISNGSAEGRTRVDTARSSVARSQATRRIPRLLHKLRK